MRRRAQQIMIEFANGLDRLLQLLIIVQPAANLGDLLRDDLDENGGGDLDFEAAAGSGVMIVADLQLCKFFRRRC